MILDLLALEAIKDKFQYPDHTTIPYMAKGLGLLVVSFFYWKKNKLIILLSCK